MLIQEKYICKNGVELTHTYSDEDFYILQKETDIKYAEAYDIPNKFTYEETSEKIEGETENEIKETK